MVVDTSALIAIVYSEAGYERLEQAIELENTRYISAAFVIEASIVVARRAGSADARQALLVLDGVIRNLGLSIEPITSAHVDLARDTFVRYGKGMNVAGLNYGDCFSHALAKETGEPLLCKGDDFNQTGVATC